MTDPLGRLQAQDRFLVRQHDTAMDNRYDVATWTDDGSAGELLATQQARMKLREEVVFFADVERQQRVFSSKAQQMLDVHGQTDVFDAYGGAVGSFRKAFGTSLLRSTSDPSQPGTGAWRGRERSPVFAVIRRVVWSWIPHVDVLPVIWPYHFDFATAEGRAATSVERRRGLRDTYRVTLSDPLLDRRLAASMTVALDVLQNR